MVSALGERAHPIPPLCFLLLCFSHLYFNLYPPLAETTSTRPTQMLLCSCVVALLLLWFTAPLPPTQWLSMCGPHTSNSAQPRQLHGREEKPTYTLHLITQTESFQRRQLIKVYRRIYKTGGYTNKEEGQELLFSLSDSFKMQQEHKTRDDVFSSAHDALGYKTAYIKQPILPLNNQIPATAFATTNHCGATAITAGGQWPWDQTTWQVALTQRRLLDCRPPFPER